MSAGRSYRYTVALLLLLAAGSGRVSADALPALSASSVPPSPASVSAQAASPTEISVSWQDRATNETSQTIYVAAGASGFIPRLTVPANVTSATLTGLPAGTACRIYVTARSAAGESAASNIVNISTPALPVARFRSLVPASAQTTGAGNSFWRTELTIFNAGDARADIELVYIPSAGGTVLRRATTLSPGKAITWENVLPQLFELPAGQGAIGIDAETETGFPLLQVSSRTYTSDSKGTYGQFVPAVGVRLPATSWITGLRSDEHFRTNIGLVNRSASGVKATLTLIQDDGVVLSTVSLPVGPSTFQQHAVTDLFPVLRGQSHAVLSLRVTASSIDAISAYASVVDNVTHDPTFIPGSGAMFGDVVVPAVARVAGAAGTFWRSDLIAHNTSSSTMPVTVRFWAADRDNRNSVARTIFVGPGGTAEIADVVRWLGIDEGQGALLVTTSSPVAPVVTSRTYTTRAGLPGTYGQWIEAIPRSRFSGRSLVTGLKSDASFRSNIGWVNSGENVAVIDLALIGANGAELGRRTITALPFSQSLTSVGDLFEVDTTTLGNFTVSGVSSSQTVLVYGSVIDNGSGDPVYISGN